MSDAWHDAPSASLLKDKASRLDAASMHRRRRPRVKSHSRSQSSRRARPNKVSRDNATTDRRRSYADVQRSKADNAVGIRFEKAPPAYDRFVYHAEARRPRRPHSREIKSRRHKRPAARSASERHEAGTHEAVRHERRRSRHSMATVSHPTERPQRRRSRRPKSSADPDGRSTRSPTTSATEKRTERSKRSIIVPSQSLADEPVFQDGLTGPPSDTDDTQAISQPSLINTPTYRLSFLGGLSVFRSDPVKQHRKFDEKQRKKQLKEQALQARKEAQDQRAAEKEKLAQKRKVAALVEQQKRDAAKARRKQEKEDKQNAAQTARQAKASEAFMLAQQRERERELSELGRKQRRLMSITPFRPRDPSRSGPRLAPLQRHLLVKTLVMMQMQTEWQSLARRGMIGLYGYPFVFGTASPERHKWTSMWQRQRVHEPHRMFAPTEEPLILRHLFHVHMRPFPGLSSAPPSFWQNRVQCLIDEFVTHALSTSRERSQLVPTHILSLIATQYLGLFFARGIGVRGADELRGPGWGDPGTESWGVGKQWGAGTVKRGLARPYELTKDDVDLIDSLYDGDDLVAWQAAGRESKRVQSDFSAFKEKIIEQEDGLDEMVGYLSISNVHNLPQELQNTAEGLRIHVTLMVRWLLVDSPLADTIFETVRIIHSMFPYWAVRQALSVASAKHMVQLLLTIFLAQPVGSDSLLQRIVVYTFTRECSALDASVIEPIRRELPDVVLVNKLEKYARERTSEDVAHMEEDADQTGNDILTTILLSNWDPLLDITTQDHVLAMQKAYMASPFRANLDLAYPSSTPQGQSQPATPPWETETSASSMADAREFALLKLYLRSLLQKHDRQRMAKWFSSSLFVQFIKDLLQHVFYRGLQAASKSSDLGGRLHDFQKLVEDLIDVRRHTDNGVEHWMGLAHRHHEFIYFFVHELAPVMGPVWSWCQETLDYMSLSTSDPQRPGDRRAQDIELNPDEMLEDARLTEEDTEEIVRELNDIACYSRWSKIRRELDFRRLFLKTRASNSEMRMSRAMQQDMEDLDGLMSELLQKEKVPIDDGTCDDVRGTERSSMPWAYFDTVDPLGQSLMAEPELPFKCKVSRVGPRPPSLFYIRKLLPMFREVLIAEVPDWLDPELNGPPQPTPKNIKLSSIKLLRKTSK